TRCARAGGDAGRRLVQPPPRRHPRRRSRSAALTGVKTVTRDEVQQTMTGAQLVEVLPREEYEWAHLPGALHVPLAQLDELAHQMLERGRPIVAYCNDFL